MCKDPLNTQEDCVVSLKHIVIPWEGTARSVSPKRDFLTRQSSHYDQHRWILALVCSIVQALDTMRVPLTLEVMWNVKVGGNTFFNTLIFRKHLSQMSPLLADLWEAAEWVSPSVQGRMAAFRKGKGQRAFAFIKLVLITPLPLTA